MEEQIASRVFKKVIDCALKGSYEYSRRILHFLPGSIIRAFSCLSVFAEFLTKDVSKILGHKIKQARVKT